MKIVFFGDSITDARRDREFEGNMIVPYSLGHGYVNAISTSLIYKNPEKYQIINTGISGNRAVDLYARIKKDCWNYNPDVISLLIGVNEVWHEVFYNNGVDLERYEKVYKMILDDTYKKFPNVKFILLEPFVQKGSVTIDHYEEFSKVLDYAKVVRKIAKEYNLPFVELQKPLDEYAKKHGNELTLIDGVHPAIGGCGVIKEEWLKVFNKEIDE